MKQAGMKRVLEALACKRGDLMKKKEKSSRISFKTIINNKTLEGFFKKKEDGFKKANEK